MKKLLVLFCMAMFMLPSLQAQDVDEILGKYYESIGGVDVWKNLKSLKMSGTSSMQGMEFPITIYTKRPNLEKVEVEVQGMQIVQSYDGETAWGINPFQGDTEPTKADADMNTEAAKKRFEDELIDYKEKGHTIELLGSEEIEGTATYKIKLTKNGGDELLYFFEKDNHVPIMIRTFAGAGPMKGQAVETYLSDYEEVEGLVLPMSMTQKVNGNTFLQGTMTSVELNAEIEDEIFKFPVAEEAKEMPTKEMGDQVQEKAMDKEEMGKDMGEKMEKETVEAMEELQEKEVKKMKEKGKKKAKKKKKEKKKS